MGERQDIPLPSGPFEVTVVLAGVTHPGNLGAICRTMLNYGFDDLRLVNPRCSPDDVDTRSRAKHAGRLLDELQVFDDINAATNDCSVVIGTSGKRETGEKVLMLVNIEAQFSLEEILHYIGNSVCTKKDFECNLHVCGGKGRDIRAQFNLKNSFDFDIVCIDKEQGTQYVTLTMKELEHLTNKLRNILNLYYV